MKILFCTPNALTRTLGAPKVIMELAEEMRDLGWDCDIRGRYALEGNPRLASRTDTAYAAGLHQFLREHGEDYDVVDYDHNFLPHPRTDFAPRTLFVARSVLMAHHFDVIPVPGGRSVKSRVRRLLCGGWERSASRKRTARAHRTIQEADFVNVCSEQDQQELVRCGVRPDKIAVLPFGISRHRRPLFDAVSAEVPAEPVVAFVGTFDYRKGAREFPRIVHQIAEAVPGVRFRLLGTAGMFQTEGQVLAHFPVRLRQKIEVVPRFKPEELPRLLASCSVGLFPSHIEGFPFGVLEMLAASVPVIAYDAPGPPMMLSPEFLVRRGDGGAMAGRVAALLTDRRRLCGARQWAHQQSQRFHWKDIAQATAESYARQSEIKRGRAV